jgi:hypothetical protein
MLATPVLRFHHTPARPLGWVVADMIDVFGHWLGNFAPPLVQYSPMTNVFPAGDMPLSACVVLSSSDRAELRDESPGHHAAKPP